MIRAGIVGGTGYTGVELLRLLAGHPDTELSVITSRSEAGRPVADMFPNLRGHVDLEFTQPEGGQLAGCDLVFFATPNGTAMKLAPHHEVVAVDINPIQLAYAERRFEGDPGFRGRAERVMDFMRFFGPLAGWSSSRVRAFLDLDDPGEQMQLWERELDTWRFRRALDMVFSLSLIHI